MNDPIHGEPLLKLAEAARRLPGHRGDGRLHPATLTRWIQRGCLSASGRRVRLEALRCGGRWLTSEGALARFMDALTEGGQSTGESQSPTARRHASDVAARELDRLGA